jgi:hypothetical protein
MPETSSPERDLIELAGEYYDDPLGFVEVMFPWGEHGTSLEHHPGPDVWQRDFSKRLGQHVRDSAFDGHTPTLPIRMATSSGHGIGKSALVGMLVNWIMATRPDSQGVITANTFEQLETKTWAAVQRWTKLCATGRFFTVTATRMYHPDHKDTWFCSPQSPKEQNSESFAGQHSEGSTSFYIFDEASAIAEIIYEVAEGGLTDGEPMQFRFGNPTRSTGAFHAACFGSQRDRWDTVIVDSRTSRFSNKELIAEWEQDYGEDSDFFRVRVKGLPPSAGDAQFIDSGRIRLAQKNPANALPDDPLIAGVDVPDKGPAWFVCRFRRGNDARSIAPIRIPGDASPDFRNRLIAILAEVLRDQTPERKVAAIFIDSAFGSPIVERLHVLGYMHVHEIRFGGDSPDSHYENQRAYQWGKMKDWLPTGAIDSKDTRLEADLSGPGYHLNKRDRIVLESKKSMQARGVASPDDGDALSLTFAQPVAIALGIVEPPYRPHSPFG